ncbi:MAG: tetratricopeptide repeat protein [Pseudodesulfovibrio sp.]|nr:tetratricopeptide repeat protein [Pseudodesulfovibrio sp.]
MLDNDVLHDFFSEQKGQIVCITNDLSMVRTLRYSIASQSKAPDDLIHFFPKPETATQTLDKLHKDKTPFIVLIERKINGEKTTDIILRISRLYPLACLLVVGSNITKDLAAFFYEIGTKAIINKPVSADTLLKKLTACMTTSKEQNLTSYVRELISSANSTEALEAINKYLVLTPDSSLAYCLKGDTFLSEGNLQQATKAYERAIGITRYYTEPLKRLAAIYKYTDDDKALELLQKVDSISPFNPERKIEMAEIHLRKGNTDKATLLLERGFKQASQEFSLSLGDMAERISVLISNKIPDLAEEYLAKAIRTKKTFTMLDLHMFNKLGMIHRNKKEWKEAIEVYKKALDIAPNDPALYYNMALAYHDGKVQSDVKRCLGKAFDLDPEFYKGNEGASYNIGSIFLEYDDTKLATPFLEHALELNPDNDKTKKKLKRCKKQNGVGKGR